MATHRTPSICLLLSSSNRMFGGIESCADHLATALAARGYRLSIVTGGARGRWLALPPATAIVERASFDARSAPARLLAKLLRTSPPNAQSLIFFLACMVSPRARWLILSADVALTFLEGEAVLFSHAMRRRGVGTVYYSFGAIDRRWAVRDRSSFRVAASQALADNSTRHGYPFDGVVRPGIGADLIATSSRADLDVEPTCLLYTGRLEHHQKRPDRLLNVLAALAREFPALQLTLVGDGPEQPALARQAAELGIQDRVVFAGRLPYEGVFAALRSADVFLFPSTYESFGLSVLEAMAAGVPVVASDLPALREVTQGHALLVQSDDHAGWVAAVRRLLLESALRRELARASRARAAELTWDRTVDALEPYLLGASREAGGALTVDRQRPRP